jgi:hypothetical protein
VYARAYLLTRNQKYLAAGQRAYRFLRTPMSQGGTRSDLSDLDPSLSGYVFYEEYVSDPDGYTLNGFMFTLLGLYDWWQVCRQAGAGNEADLARNFHAGVATLAKILPLYDFGGMSAYDLGHYTFDRAEPHVSPKYHRVHIVLLHALYSITGESTLQHFEHLWRSYVD